jgi:YHS domain-containing protein
MRIGITDSVKSKKENIMKTKATLTLLIFALASGFLFFVTALNAEKDEHDHGHAETHQHADEAKSSDKVRCAIDGMMMKASAMIEAKHDGKTHYFCNHKQAEMFKAHPDSYLKQIPFGHLTFNLNVLTIDEYGEMMTDMGMGKMLKMHPPADGKTHHLSVYLTQHDQDINIDNVELALQITDAKGKTMTLPLKYNGMLKTYHVYAELPAGEKNKIAVVITTPKVSVSI